MRYSREYEVVRRKRQDSLFISLCVCAFISLSEANVVPIFLGQEAKDTYSARVILHSQPT